MAARDTKMDLVDDNDEAPEAVALGECRQLQRLGILTSL